MLAAKTRRCAQLPKISTSPPVMKPTAAVWRAPEGSGPKAAPTKPRRTGVP
jgi:hypothetical protein